LFWPINFDGDAMNDNYDDEMQDIQDLIDATKQSLKILAGIAVIAVSIALVVLL
jgi:hypothetical protein